MKLPDSDPIFEALGLLAKQARIARIRCEELGLITPLSSLVEAVPGARPAADELAAVIRSTGSKGVGLDREKIKSILDNIADDSAAAVDFWGRGELANPIAKAFRDIGASIRNLDVYLRDGLVDDQGGDSAPPR